MWVIGITGGVGAGKSSVLNYMEEKCNCRIVLADDVGNKVKLPGEICYNRLVELLGRDILDEDGTINKARMAEAIFSDDNLLLKVNAIIHPAVEEYILSEIRKEKEAGKLDFFFVEAALLIECGYGAHVDEMWYVYASENVRRARLKENRSYSDEKISAIMQEQLAEEEFRKACQVVIDNSGDMEDTKKQIDKILGDRLWKVQENFPDN
jgi:dephospho-CoA kinase